MEKILIIQRGNSREALLTTPLIRVLRKTFSTSKIFLLCTPETVDLFRHNPNLTSILIHNQKDRVHQKGLPRRELNQALKQVQFSKVFVVDSSWQSAVFARKTKAPFRIGFSSSKGSLFFTEKIRKPKLQHEAKRNLLLAANFMQSQDAGVPELFLRNLEHVYASRLLAGYPSRLISVAPFTDWVTKNWPLDFYVEAFQTLQKNGYFIVLLGQENHIPESEYIEDRIEKGRCLNLVGQTTLRQAAAVIKASKCAVVADDIMLQLCSAMRKPTVAIYGSTIPEFGFGPIGQTHIILENTKLKCRPCTEEGRSKCPKRNLHCLVEIRPWRLVSAIKEMMEKEYLL